MTMYSLKPIIHRDIQTDWSDKCMYKMKNIHGDCHPRQECRIMSTVNEQVINFLKNPWPEITALETRQENILSQLAQLKEQVLNLCDVLKENKEIEGKSDSRQLRTVKRKPVNADLVINVDPSRPCYSVLALEKLWPDVDFRVSTFVHSSVDEKIPTGFERIGGCGKMSCINLALIWKKVDDMELVLSGSHCHPIIGEINLLKYLARLLDDYDSLPPGRTMNIERILDLAHQLIHQDNQKARQLILNILNEKITKDNWFSGEENPGISDAAAWSAIKQTSCKTLPPNLSSWFKRSETFFSLN